MSGINSDRTNFVIVHGGWAGGWAWQRVVDRLHDLGHRAFAPTLTGLGERSHLAGVGVDMQTHIADIVNEIVWKDLNDVVLVGHSYGGMVTTGVIERIPERIASVVFVEPFIPGDNQSFSDLVPDWELDGPLTDAPPTSPGDYVSEADRLWVDAKATPQPTATLTQRQRVTGAYRNISKRAFVQATNWDLFADMARKYEQEEGWTVHRIASGHDIAIDAPDELVAVLVEAI
ncbi:esterase [Devosia yakushimensis]|uniref:Esterase n=1 Tax=Devosia yakushimensis TaxID=470028 RepID=A0ABQ5UCT5_9HYPH|nr:alpha/beta hydrolase [Devosia yakushimensis]GLQ09545.1 esterase [Devosia yakushimensis]